MKPYYVSIRLDGLIYADEVNKVSDIINNFIDKTSARADRLNFEYEDCDWRVIDDKDNVVVPWHEVI